MISIGGLVEIVPLYLSNEVTTPAPGVKPYDALALEGRDIYVREGCYNCHSQMIRPLRAETERYGHYSLAGESVYDHPFQFGSKRTGPGPGARRRPLQRRVASRAPHESARRGAGVEHAARTRGWRTATVDADGTPREDARAAHGRRAVHGRGHRGRRGAVRGKTEMDALIAYLQGLGTASANW